jgi:GTPase SAR1 family protein
LDQEERGIERKQHSVLLSSRETSWEYKEMAKTRRKIKANDFLRDLHSGLGRTGLCRKYGLSDANLERVTDQIVKAGLLDRRAILGYLAKSQPVPPDTRDRKLKDVSKSGKPPRIWTPEEINALRGQVGISGHVEFVSRLLARHKLDKEAETESQRLLDRIRRREGEDSLFLGIIGEFSSGKSTLINALIGDDLLRADVIQATTAAATELRHGKDLNVEVVLENGEKRSFLNDKLSLLKRFARWRGRNNPERQKVNIRDFIHAVTADEAVARHVTQVQISHPSDTLRQGMVIVDTPGTNADNERHVVVTQWAIREICDAAMVVIPADIPVSQTLVAFLASHLSDVLHRCVFIVTKLDLIKPREIERQLEAVRNRLKSYLGLPAPLVLGCAPQLIVDGLNGDRRASRRKGVGSDEHSEELNKKFHRVEKTVWSTLREQKFLIQLERLSGLMSQVLSTIEHTLKLREEDYRERHDELERNKIPDLWDFVKAEQTRHTADFTSEVEPYPNQALHIVGNARDECLSELKREIYSFEDKEDLKSALESDESVARNLVDRAKEQIESRVAAMTNQIGSVAQQRYEEFMKEFTARYDSLATLGGRISETADGSIFGRRLVDSGFHRTLDDLRSDLGEEIVFSGLAKGGGALGGLVLGALVFGPLGAIVAGGIGALLAWLLGPNLDELKDKCWNELELSIQDRFTGVEKDVMDQMRTVIDSAQANLKSTIERYYQEYDQLVRQMIERDETEKDNLSRLRQTTSHDLREISARQQRLEQVRTNLSKL